MKMKSYLTIFAIVSLAILCPAQQNGYTIIEVGRCKTGVAYDVFAIGSCAYVTTNHGITIIDIKDKIHPKIIGKINTKRSKKLIKDLKKKIKETSPSELGGFKDTWDCFEILPAEGLSLQMKNFCFLINKECQYKYDDFLECKNICDRVADGLINFLHNRLFDFVKKEGPDNNGEYPLYKLFKFNK